MTAQGDRRRTGWVRAALVAGSIAVGGLAFALVFVRVSLDWSDSQPYQGAETEIRYIVFACIALLIAGGSAAGALVYWLRARRPR